MPKLTYLGHSAFLLEGSNATLVIDPFLTDNPLAKTKPSDIRADYVLITHGHGDHLGDSIQIAKNNNATIISTFEMVNYCMAKGANGHPMHIGGAYNFPFGRVKLTIAHHGSSTPDGAYMGQPSGMLITMDGKTLYHAGDTALFYDMKLIGEMNKIDVACLPIGDNFTMGIDDAVKATEFLNPQLVIPMHYKTFEVIDVNPNEFVEKASAKGFKARIMEVNETIEF
ncbi:MAG: metal-dependent hydrolase [Calditrichaeota bacterium]|nr:MAG: metal-dependent hydrolase [Calditrichota bacterium]